MSTHSFTLLLQGADVSNEGVLDRLYDVGCDDASFGTREGKTFAEFDREAATLAEAIASAIRQVELVPGVIVLRVEEQDLVTIADIATLTGRTRQNVWQLTAGKRGRGGFPAPATTIGADHSLWRWSDVLDWLRREGKAPQETVEAAHVVAAVNAWLDARTRLNQLGDRADRIAVETLLHDWTLSFDVERSLTALSMRPGHHIVWTVDLDFTLEEGFSACTVATTRTLQAMGKAIRPALEGETRPPTPEATRERSAIASAA